MKPSHFKKPILLLIFSLILTSSIIASIAGYDMYKEQKYQRLTERATIKPVKVFQIGFSKCGTVTVASFFSQNGIRTVHHDFGNLAVSMYKNYHNGKPLLSPKYQHFAVFTDMENMFMNPPLNIGMLMFKELDKQYPGSKFILNIRDKNAWLKSRSKHPLSPRNKTTILELNAELQNKSKEQILAQWSKEWDEHTQAVIKYFKNRPNDLIVFNIEKDSPEKLTEFFKDYFVLDPKLYAHKNQSSQRDMIRANAEKNRLEWNEIFGGAEDN